MEWINIKDNFPKTESLLLTTSKKILIGDWYNNVWRVSGKIRWEESIKGGFELVSDLKTSDITHWMPLPELPIQPKLTWQYKRFGEPDIFWKDATQEEYEVGKELTRYKWRQIEK